MFYKPIINNKLLKLNVLFPIIILLFVLFVIKIIVTKYNPYIMGEYIGIKYALNHLLSFKFLNFTFQSIPPVTAHFIGMLIPVMFFNVLYKLTNIGSILFVVGGLSNLMERFFDGFVTDYIFVYIPNSYLFPMGFICNMADVFICVGLGLFVFNIIKSYSPKATWKSYTFKNGN